MLEGQISSVNSYEFDNAKKTDSTISAEDIEYVLNLATLIVLAGEPGGYVRHYFYSGASEGLDSIFNLCLGYSKDLENKKYKSSLERFKRDIHIVEEMGLLDVISDNNIHKR